MRFTSIRSMLPVSPRVKKDKRVRVVHEKLFRLPVPFACEETLEMRKWFYVALKIYQLVKGLNTLRPRQNGRHFADDIFKCIFLNENVWILIKISLKFVPKGPINNIPALVQIMAWRRPGDKPLSEPLMVSLLTHICVTRPQWVNTCSPSYFH